MKNYKIKLPIELHSEFGVQPNISFSMSKDSIWINGKEEDNPLKAYIDKGFKGYKANIMNTYIIVSIYATNDILERV